MGPGFHSQNEALWFAKKFPHVAFLDQPPHLLFSELVAWAVQQIQNLSRGAEKSVTLLGHSFGAQIIAGSLAQAGHLIAEVRLLNSAFDPFECFCNLEAALEPSTAQGIQFWRPRPLAEKLNLILRLSQHPQFAELYWLDSGARQKYENLSAQTPVLDPRNFMKTFANFLEAQKRLQFTPWQGSCKIYYSSCDKLIRAPEAIAPWLQIFPQAQLIEVEPVGHHALFERESVAELFFEKRS